MWQKQAGSFSTALKSAVEIYAQEIKTAHDQWMTEHCPNVQKSEIEIQYLQKRIRINLGTSVFCFVEANGDIMKAAGYKAPAKGARGNVYTAPRPVTARQLYK